MAGTNASIEGRVNYSFLYYPELAGDNKTKSYNLTPNVQSWTHTTSMFGPQTLIIKLAQKLDWLNSESKGFLVGQVGANEQIVILALEKYNQTWNVVTDTPEIILEFKSIVERDGIKLSKYFPGGLSEIMAAAYDVEYTRMNLKSYQPGLDFSIEPSIRGESLWQFQSIPDYIKEARGYAVAPDNSPVFIWHDMNRIRCHSAFSLLEQTPVSLVATTTEAAGKMISTSTRQGDSIVAYCVDYREEVAADIRKMHAQRNTRYIIPRTGGEQFMYSRHTALEEAPTDVKVLYQPQNIVDQTKNGIAVTLAEMWKTALSIGRASVLMYNETAFLRPGALVNIIMPDASKEYLVVMNATEGSAVNGFQTIYLLDTLEARRLLEEFQSIDSTTPVKQL